MFINVPLQQRPVEATCYDAVSCLSWMHPRFGRSPYYDRHRDFREFLSGFHRVRYTISLDFIGFDSDRISVLRGGILISTGNSRRRVLHTACPPPLGRDEALFVSCSCRSGPTLSYYSESYIHYIYIYIYIRHM